MERETYIQTETGKRMLRAVTPNYTDEYQLSIFNANGLVMEEVSGAANKINMEVLINNATWSLPYWESLFRIKSKDNQTIEQRRRAVILKMNEYFPVTRRRMETIVDTFTENGGTVINDKRGDYTFEIILRNSGAIDFINMVAAVEETKPAHLATLFAALADDLKAIIHAKQYTFPVQYPITGTFHTSPTNGVASKAAVDAKSKSYTFQVPYNVTGAFSCSAGKMVNPNDIIGGDCGEPYYLEPIIGGYCGDPHDEPEIIGGDCIVEINST